MDAGGWKLAVRTTNRASRRHVFSALTTSKCRAKLDGQSSGNAFVVETAPTSDRRQALAELTARMERYEHKLPHKFLHTILCCITRILRNSPLALIRAFGIGSFETAICSAYQLILLEAIKKRFGVSVVTCQDPVTTLCERDYLENEGITVLPADDLLSAPPVDVGTTEFTLLYMIHCTAEMYDNVLSYYSHRLQNFILIGNDLNSTTFTVGTPSDAFPHLTKFSNQTVAFSLPRFEPSEFAFDFTFIIFFDAVDTEADNEDEFRKISFE